MTMDTGSDCFEAVVARLTARLSAHDPEALRGAEETTRRDLAGEDPDLPAADLERLTRLALDRAEDALGRRIPRARRRAVPTPRPPLRGEGWGACASDVLVQRRALDEMLGAPAARQLGSEGLAGRILAAAFLRGGLWRPEALAALAATLAARRAGDSLRRSVRRASFY